MHIIIKILSINLAHHYLKNLLKKTKVPTIKSTMMKVVIWQWPQKMRDSLFLVELKINIQRILCYLFGLRLLNLQRKKFLLHKFLMLFITKITTMSLICLWLVKKPQLQNLMYSALYKIWLQIILCLLN